MKYLKIFSSLLIGIGCLGIGYIGGLKYDVHVIHADHIDLPAIFDASMWCNQLYDHNTGKPNVWTISYWDGKGSPNQPPILEAPEGFQIEVIGTGTCDDFKKIFSLPNGMSKHNDVIPKPQSHNWTCKFPIKSYGKDQTQGVLLVSNNKMCDFGVQYQFIEMDMSDVEKPDNSIPSTIHP